MRIAALPIGLVGLMLAASGCDSSSRQHTVAVFAAASLTKTFTELSPGFTDANPDVDLELSFGGSAALLTQLTQGAHGDVFASADIATMDKAEKAGLLAQPPVPFASNTLAIAVAPGNPKGITSFGDLAGVTLVVCAAQVPCGAALPRMQTQAGVQLHPVSEETSVSDVLNKVTSGQADAGLVYVTDVKAAGSKVGSVPFPEAASAINTYEIAVLKDAVNSEAARRFVALVTGPDGQRALRAAGFGTP